MFGREEYSALIACPGVPEAAAYLRDSVRYADVLSGVDISSVHRGMLESLLRKSAFMTYIRITGFEQLNKQEFYNFRILWAETEELLRCIRHINAGSDGFINDAPIYIYDYTVFDLTGLAQVRTFAELVAFLKGTRYDDVLKPLAPKNGENVDYTACEMALRKLYYSRIMRSAEMFEPGVSRKLKELIGAQNDLTNIINSYRMKMYFHEDTEDISKRMLPYGKMKASKLPELYEFADEGMFRSQLARTRYGRSMKYHEFDAEELEQAVFKLKYHYVRSALSSSQDAPLSVYAFCSLAENEVSNIIRVIESIRYNIPAAEIEKLLIY